MAGIHPFVRRAVVPALLMSVALVGACPRDEVIDPTTANASKLDLPDRYETGPAVVLLRLSGGASTTITSVHRALGRLFASQVSAMGAVQRGGEDTTPAASDAEALAGSSADQVRALLKRMLVSKKGPFSAAEAKDACGNPMVASFVTPEVLAGLMPTGTRLSDVVSGDACGSSGGCDTTETGIWDVTLTEERNDGMVDAFMAVYPAVTQLRPGFLGHLAGFFLTDKNPGFWQAPLFVAADRVQVSLQGLLQLDRRYSDRHHKDSRSIYRFPHMERTIARNDLLVTLLGDPLCDVHHGQRFEGTTPFGCNLPDGRDLAVQLDVDTPVGEAIYDRVLGGGTKSAPLESVQDALAWQVGAFLACPTFEEELWVKDDLVEVLVCPDGDLDACIGWHDMEQAGCEHEDAAVYPPVDLTAPTIGSGTLPTLTPQDDTVRITQEVPFDDGLGGPLGTGMELAVAGTRGQTVVLFSDSLSRISLIDPSGNPVTPADRPDSHCGERTAREWTFSRAGSFTLRITGDSPIELMLTRQDLHIP